MAVVLVEGFDHLTAAQFITKQGRPVAYNVTTGRFAGQAAHANSTNASIQLALPAAYTTFIFGVAFKNWDLGNDTIILYSSAGGATVVGVRVVSVGPNAVIRVVNSAGTTLATGTTPLIAGTWYYLEIKVVVSATVGTVEVRLNGAGTAECSGTGLNTGTNGVDFIILRTYTAATGMFDDVYGVDTTGSSPTNTFLGDVRVETLYPNGNGANTAWTGVYTDWDDPAAHDTDTTYVSSSTPGDRETSTLTDLAVTAGAVYAVQTNLMARKDDAGARTIAPVLRVGGTNYDGTTTGGLTASYVGYTQLYDRLDPSGAAWSIATVNAMEAGVKEVA